MQEPHAIHFEWHRIRNMESNSNYHYQVQKAPTQEQTNTNACYLFNNVHDSNEDVYKFRSKMCLARRLNSN